MKLRTRLAVGALAVVLPAAAVAGCGVEKKRTIEAEMSAAGENLKDSKALSVTLRFHDSDGNLKTAMIEDDASFEPVSGAVLKGGITYTVDPVGNQTLRDVQVEGQSEEDVRKGLKDVNVALVIRGDKAALGEIRLVAGTLYARVDIRELNRLMASAGEGSLDDDLDDLAEGDAQLSQGVADVRAGKWIRLPLLDYIDRFKELANSFGELPQQPTASGSPGPDLARIGDRIYNAVKPHLKVTDANDDSADRVLDVEVDVRPALKAALTVLKASTELPFHGALQDVTSADIDKNVASGTARGTIKLADGHLREVSIDLESFRKLDPTASSHSLEGSSVVLELDDSADEVEAPTNVSSFDLGDLFESLFDSGEEDL